MMTDDPVIARIRDARHKISARFHHNPRKLVAHYIKLHEKCGDRIFAPCDKKTVMVLESRENYSA